LNALRAGNGDSVFTPQLGSTTAIPGLRGDVIPPDTLLHRQALAQNPQLRSAAGAVVRADRAASTFAIAGRPDFTIGVQAGARLGGRETFLTALVGMSVPLYAGRKQTPAAQAARLERAATEQIYDDLTTQLIAEIAAAAAHVRALRDRILQTADQILPLAEAASASALQRYRVGALEFSAVLDAQDDLFESQLRLADLIAEYGAAWGELTALLGEEWYQ
jgi:outer membrane protein TolC